MHRPIVVYATAWPQGDLRHLNKADYAETWYYTLQVALINAFAALSHYTIVVKPYPMQPVAPLERVIADRAVDHLYLSRAPLNHWLPWAARVVFDNPSTGVYETAVAGVPLHLLVYRRFALRESGVARFAQWMTVFDEPGDAARAVVRYLSMPDNGSPKIAPDGVSTLETLTRLTRDRARSGSRVVDEAPVLAGVRKGAA